MVVPGKEGYTETGDQLAKEPPEMRDSCSKTVMTQNSYRQEGGWGRGEGERRREGKREGEGEREEERERG